MTRPAIATLSILAVLLPLAAAGCGGGMPAEKVELIQHRVEMGVQETSAWKAREVVGIDSPRGQHELIAHSPAVPPGQPVERWLYIKIIYPIEPARVGHDPTTLNARVGYLAARTDGGGSHYYEGAGNVYVSSPWHLFGRRRFELQRAMLRLTRASEGASSAPLVNLELAADLSAHTAPDAAEQIEAMLAKANALPPVRMVRRAGLAAVARMPLAKQFFMKQAMGSAGLLPAMIREHEAA